MTGAEISTDAWSNESVTPRKKSREDCAVVFRPDHVVRRALDRIATAPHDWTMEAWRMLDAGDVGVSVRHERCG